MHIKIFNQNQLEVLKSINPIFGKHRIPKAVIYEMEYILNYEKTKDIDCIALIMNPVKNDTVDILKDLGLCTEEVDIQDNNFHPIKVRGKKHPMKRRRIWTWFDILIPSNDRTIYVVYCMKKKDLYKKGDW